MTYLWHMSSAAGPENMDSNPQIWQRVINSLENLQETAQQLPSCQVVHQALNAMQQLPVIPTLSKPAWEKLVVDAKVSVSY